MTDLTSAGAAEGLRLTGGIAGHVVLVHIPLVVLVVEPFELLHFGDGAEGGDGHRLRLTSGEHGGTVSAREQTHFAPDGTDVREAPAVGTHAAVEDLGADLLFLEVIETVEDELGLLRDVVEVVREVREDVGVELVLSVIALGAVEALEDVVHLLVRIGAHCLVDVVGDGLELDVDLGLADFGDDAVDERDDLLDLLMTEEDGAEHLFLGDDVRSRLHHHDGVAGAGKAQMQLGLRSLRAVGVDDVLAVNETHHHGARGARKGDVGDGQRDGRTDHAEHLGRDVGVHRKHGGNDGNVVVHPLGEQRTDGAVDETRGEDRLVGRSALSLLEAAGDLAHGVHLLFIVHAEGEVIHALAGFLRHSGVDHDHGVAAAHDAAAVRLTAVGADLDGHLSAADCCLENFSFHINSFRAFRHAPFL